MHIIPVSFHLDDIVEGLKLQPPNEAVLISIYTEGDRDEKIILRNVKKIKKAMGKTIKVTARTIGTYEVDAVAKELSTILSSYEVPKNEVYVNVSSGFSFVNALLIQISILKGFKSYVLRRRKYLVPPYKTELSKGIEEIFLLPSIPHLELSDQENQILKVLVRKGGGAQSQMILLDALEKNDFFKMEKYFKRRRKRILANRKTMLTRLLKGLETKGMIEREARGRDNIVKLTHSAGFYLNNLATTDF